MDLDAYVSERRGEWNRLDALTRRRKLTAAEADELVLLYQRAATHLSVVRSHSPDPILLATLSQLVIAARSAVTGGRRFSWRPVARFFTTTLPVELYRSRRWWLAVTVLNVLVAGGLMAYFAAHPEIIATFVPPAVSEQYAGEDFVRYYSEYQAQNFAANVWTHNAMIAGQCLASGVLIVPVLWILAQNTFDLGLTGALMMNAGEGETFFVYILPHGFLELTAIFVAAGVGLRIGWAWIAPGPHRTRGRALAERARAGMLVALGLVVMLLVSGILEAYVTPSGWPDPVRIGIGLAVWLAFLGYALGLGAAADRRGESTDLAPEHTTAEVPTA
ncbi:membrane protein [Actinoplanes sp. NBRC 14428]|uniref:Putative membrane protein SpoIIM required for sporulation n=1 Tax=Pseudosporangium ferrugineum TaxID=439699 RepID=A0A2T0R960_9ACTN|nr:stage II sporulation protein M [Pseudosporangium ferrugineum]PRY17680.1 putative membrane protein SpoIIM required for sporulation [Pseudosporangium ferrugineum]BCJ51337.1 membrane protein [Actinoplanes sp. NBRC 14428]